jgi:hypothetical protein
MLNNNRPKKSGQTENRLPAFHSCAGTTAPADRYTSFTFFRGRLRTGLPVAACIAFSTEGVTTQIVGSPTPPQKSKVGTITVSTLGISASNIIL